ncbi:MAG: ABC transporter ATP-binding protein [Thermodesulfobacteriota bacterium]
MTNAIKTSSLNKYYKKGVRGRKVEALSSLDLEVRLGEVFGFIGSNGAGKSTTIRILMGLNRPSSGQAWLFDRPVDDPGARERVGYLSEHPHFYEFLTPMELFDLLGTIRGMQAGIIRQRTDELLDLVSLAEAANRKIRGFSKGMVQRLGIAAALLGDPDLLILDEPMSGLDPLGRHLVTTLIRDLQNRGKTIFFSTHIIPDIETLCDRVGILVNGAMKYVGSIGQALYPAAGKLEVTFRAESARAAELAAAQQIHYRWQKEGAFRTEINEGQLPSLTEKIIAMGGSVISVELKKRSLEELYLTINDDQQAGNG